MAQMSIQVMSGRADPFSAALPAAAVSPPRVAIPRTTYLYDSGGISGGKLRPGSIDQEQFKAYLAAARKEAVAAPPTPLAAPVPAPAARGVPTLSPAQLAALGVDLGQLPAPEYLDAAAFETSAGAPGESAAAVPGDALDPTAPDVSASEIADAVLDARTESAALPPSPAPAPRERGLVPGARRGADGVWELTRLPDKDERAMLYGQKWRVVESQRSRELFLGPDGEFGWDDFLDLINPLQHIPFVNIAYRAITGDEIYGAARMVDMAFGPLAAASTALDLAVQDVTGESMVDNAVAALFGPGEASGGEEHGGDVSVNTASFTSAHMADLTRRGSNK